MPRDYDPVPDPYEDNPPRARRAPRALRRLQKLFTYDKKIENFRQVFGRDPAGNAELDAFAEAYLLELSNSGVDEVRSHQHHQMRN